MKQKKNKRPGAAVYQFPYYKSEKGFLRIFLIKAFFACALAYSGAGLFAVVLEMDVHTYASMLTPIDPVTSAVLGLIVCLVTYVLLSLFRKLYVLIFDIVVFLLFFSDAQLVQSGQDMLYQIFQVADGNIVSTAEILSQSELRNPLPCFMALIFIYGALCAFSSCQRFRPLAVMTFAEIMMIPAFLGQNLHFSRWLAVLIAALFGMWTVTVAAAADATLSSGFSSNLHMSDYVYLKANKKLAPLDKLHSDSLHFGKHLSHCLTVFLVTLLTLGIASSSFPEDGSLRLDELASSAMDMTKDIGYWFYDIFGGSGLNGFFSADGGDISISGNIDPESLPTGNRPVAEIVTANTDKLYLRGDVGYSFKGDQWKTIADLNYSRIQTESGYNMQEVLDSYAPEMQYYLARCLLSRYYAGTSDILKMQTVKVNYLQDINTLLMAGSPYVFNNFRENSDFSIYGDFVAIADKGRVNSMRSAVMYSSDNSYDIYNMTTHLNGLFMDRADAESIRTEWDSLFMPMSYGEYVGYISSYRDFVYEYYTDVPEAEIGNISGFLYEVFGGTPADDTLVMPIYSDDSFYNAANTMDIRASDAATICSYLSSGRVYRYSLNVDNTSGGNTFLGNFLYETRSGHCALYATTMCLALRYMGVPARYVTGFTVGGSNSDYKKTDEGYSYTLLEKDLHAWVEVYFDDVGWIPYDPTPGRGGSAGGYVTEETTTTRTTPPTYDTPAVSGSTSSLTSETTTTTPRPDDPSGTGTGGSGEGTGQGIDPEVVRVILIIIGILAAVLVIVLSIVGALKTLRRKERILIRFFRTGNPARAIGDMFTFTLKILDMMGIQRESGETPTEFALRADSAFRAGLGIGLEQAMPLFQRREFDSDPEFTEEEQQLVYGAVSDLYGELMLNKKGLKGLLARIKLFGGVKLRKDK